jgi:GNAT superfamily N-acetyltransferase
VIDQPVVYSRLDLPLARVLARGWPRNLRAIRRSLPAHLHHAPLSAAARCGFWVVTAKVGRTPVGLAWAVGEPGGAYIEEVAVLEPYRCRGIATALLGEIARWMIELDRPNLSIFPLSDTRWVTKAGFRPVECDRYVVDARTIVEPPGR